MAQTDTFQTNKLSDYVAVRTLVNIPFLTVGSRGYFKDQLVGKRNGQEYGFVIKDAGQVEGGTPGALAHSAASDVHEAVVKMQLVPWHIMINTNAIEAVTDTKWDEAIAKPNANKLTAYVNQDAVSKALSHAATAVVGEGFEPLALAGAQLEAISPEKIYGFIDPKFQAILTTNGQQFQPVGSPDSFYSKGLLGTFHSVEYRSQRYFPVLKVDSALATWLAGASVKAAGWDPTNQTLTLTSTDNTFTGKLPKGLPIIVEDLFACDTVGMPTDSNYAFVVSEESAAAVAGEVTVKYEIKVENFQDVTASTASANDKASGTAIYALANGTIPKATDLNGKKIQAISAGKYVCGQLRLDGAYEFETLDKLDASNAETKVSSIEGVTIHENRAINIDAMTNKTRWDIVAMYGVTDPRCVVNVYSKVK